MRWFVTFATAFGVFNLAKHKKNMLRQTAQKTNSNGKWHLTNSE